MSWQNRTPQPPGAFEQHKYACMQQSQQGRFSASADRYEGKAEGTFITNRALFDACMNAKGWFLREQAQKLDVADIATQSQRDIEDVRSSEKSMCERADLVRYYKKSPCLVRELTLEHFNDKSKITDEEKPVVFRQMDAFQDLHIKRKSLLQKLSDPWAKTAAVFISNTYIPSAIRNNLDLYNGNITWGQHNIRRRDLGKEFSSLVKDGFD